MSGALLQHLQKKDKLKETRKAYKAASDKD